MTPSEFLEDYVDTIIEEQLEDSILFIDSDNKENLMVTIVMDEKPKPDENGRTDCYHKKFNLTEEMLSWAKVYYDYGCRSDAQREDIEDRIKTVRATLNKVIETLQNTKGY